MRTPDRSITGAPRTGHFYLRLKLVLVMSWHWWQQTLFDQYENSRREPRLLVEMFMRQGKTEKTWYDNQYLLSEKLDLKAISLSP
jgi:hypothetical protein